LAIKLIFTLNSIFYNLQEPSCGFTADLNFQTKSSYFCFACIRPEIVCQTRNSPQKIAQRQLIREVCNLSLRKLYQNLWPCPVKSRLILKQLRINHIELIPSQMIDPNQYHKQYALDNAEKSDTRDKSV